MRLSDLTGPNHVLPADAASVQITGITADSRAVERGFLFAALPGTKVDGARFAMAAKGAGAAAILASERADLPEGLGIPVVRANKPRKALAEMAARFHGRQPASIVAVTGTNGKTSVAEFTRQIFEALGRRAASLGTLGLVRPGGAAYGSLTTPDPVSLHRSLAALATEEVTHLALEASSHGLDQYRLDGVRLAAAAFTNLGRDHLDYHATVEDYLAAKLRLFRVLLEAGRSAVVNADGAGSERVIDVAHARGLKLITTGVLGETLRLANVRRDGFAQRLEVIYEGRTFELLLPLVGAYQAENALVAAGLAIAVGEEPARAIAAISAIKGVKGRVEIAGTARGGLVVIDYAHKPEALSSVLDALRPFASSRLICVFGCGGDRDKGKRPIMGRIAAEKADITIVTDDNPRSETPSTIRTEVLGGTVGARGEVRDIGGRAEAIGAAIGMLSEGDVLVVAGKGHETGQIVGNDTLPFSDHDVVATFLARV
ncbi:MAG TPA: UDP-N-acetylmuramoyl-L-alanyl-D-glutamate--2,6-diaminopimelate ligase [Hyphomicrobiaceae bacterium]|nr:UDP-N-acetylmuramoyl-L-alanyl-D-glutamate--2,6-diaminopimelate ligase [Hyphomicrobiaceae bacterium]